MFEIVYTITHKLKYTNIYLYSPFSLFAYSPKVQIAALFLSHTQNLLKNCLPPPLATAELVCLPLADTQSKNNNNNKNFTFWKLLFNH